MDRWRKKKPAQLLFPAHRLTADQYVKRVRVGSPFPHGHCPPLQRRLVGKLVIEGDLSRLRRLKYTDHPLGFTPHGFGGPLRFNGRRGNDVLETGVSEETAELFAYADVAPLVGAKRRKEVM
jgi:hypothetical protein